MVRFIRLILGGSVFYPIAADIYHYSRQSIMRFILLFSKVKYLKPKKYCDGGYKSQYGQDYYLEKLGLLAPAGFFVEIGCNHPIENSNSYYLEKNLGWRGVCIDGIDYSELFSEHRNGSVFVNVLIDECERDLDFHVVRNVCGWENQVSSVYKDALEKGKGFDADVVKLRAMPLSMIHQIDQPIDLCLIDVEGHELSVLRSVDYKKNPPKVFVVENNGEFYRRSVIVKFLTNRGYKHVARIGTTDDIFCLASHRIGLPQ